MGRIRRALCRADALAIEPADHGAVHAGFCAAAEGAGGCSLCVVAGRARQTVAAAFARVSDGPGVVAAAIAATSADYRGQEIRGYVPSGANSTPRRSPTIPHSSATTGSASFR